MAEPKPKPTDSLRTPKPKKKLGLSVPPALRLPHEDLITTEQRAVPPEPKQEQVTLTSMTSHTSEESPVAPQRDYTKVANSISRQAVPAGLFTGKSKQLYDCLYVMTRGAIIPTRTVRISRPKLMAKAHIGSRVTFDANVERLISVGLIRVRQIAGEHEGNEYTVYIPGEVELSMPSQTSLTSQTSSAQKLVRLVRLETSQTRHTLNTEESISSTKSKTSFKTNTENDDDEAFAALVQALRKATSEITGKEPAKADATRWQEVADVLIAELKIAAARTHVSSVPSFLAEHLRRRLWKLDKKQARLEGKELPDETAALVPSKQASDCPDCRGTGFYYPKGYEGGVAKCKHKRSSNPTSPASQETSNDLETPGA